METTISFGYWIRRQRKALDLTQQGLAERVGCSLAAIKKIERVERRPSRQIAERLADVLDVPVGQREIFLEIARGMGPVDQLLLAHEPTARPSLPSGTVTFLFTDIKGSTLLSQSQPEAMKHVLARHHAILRAAIESNSGHVLQIVGDSFSAAFDNARDALNAALDAQRDLRDEPWGEITPIRVRMGLHTGMVKITEDSRGMPYSGYSTMAFTQRIMSTAYGGQILLSQVTHELLEGFLPPGVTLRDMGEHRLKDLLHPIHLYQVTVSDLPADFPSLNTLELFPHNLPIQLTSFIGRVRELAEVKQLLSNTHLLTFTGPGGTGKTRLALQIGEKLLPSLPDGVWVAELASLTDASFIPQTIAAIFGLRELPNMSLTNIVTDYLRAKQLLLILDNCEHLIQACAKLADQLLHACPQLKIIASSREALGIAGETAYRVPSLSLPDRGHVTREAVIGFESVQLFVERASAANPKFNLTDENASAVAQICRRLDGIPLALELAAARSLVFSPEEIAAHLDDRFRLLTGGSRTALERHQTLQALIDWSYDLLSEEERRLFRYLSVFAGSWTFGAAEAVCSDLDVLNLLPQLINKSLVMADADAQAIGMRYHLLETIRQYARTKLLEAGDAEQVRNRHLDFFLKFAEKAESHYNSLQELEWMSQLEADNDNLRAALEWAMEQDVLSALRLGTALYPFWNRHGQEAEGCRILRQSLARLKALPLAEGEAAHRRMTVQVKAMGALEVLSFAQGDFVSSLNVAEEVIELSRRINEKHSLSEALFYLAIVKAFLGDAEISVSMAEEALTLARELGDRVLLGLGLTNMAGVIALTQGDSQKMQACSEEGIRLLKEAGAQWGVAMASFGTGLFSARQGNYAEARSQFEASIPVFRELRDRHRVNMAYSEISHIERRQGYFAQAKTFYKETIQEWQSLGHRAAIAHELECIAIIAKAQEEDQRAARLFGAAEILRENNNMPMTPLERIEYEREVNDLRANMEEAAFARAWEEGRAMSMEQAIALAIENEDSPLPKA
jgi:predicted ATPase/class 3 adenylate cyclase